MFLTTEERREGIGGTDVGSIYNSIEKFFENDNYKKYGLNALNFSKEFQWNKIIKKYLQLI